MLSWSPDQGVRLRGAVERHGPPLKNYSPAPVRVRGRKSWVRIDGVTSFDDEFYVVKPAVSEMDLHLGQIDEHFSLVTFERAGSPTYPGPGRLAFGLLDFGDHGSPPLMPDKVERTLVVGDRQVRQGGSWHGLREERPDAYEVTGHFEADATYFWLSVCLPSDTWSEEQAWRWIDASPHAFAWLSGKVPQCVYLEQTTKAGLLRRCYRRRERVFGLRPYLPVVGTDRVDKKRFLAICDLLATEAHEAKLAEEMLRQLVDAKGQQSQVGRDLLFSSILEALLRNITKNPFQGQKAKDPFNLDNALANFSGTRLGSEYRKIKNQVSAAFLRLRDRAAHPDWLLLGDPDDGLSKQALDDRLLLAAFYFYVVLAFAGVRDLKPRVPGQHSKMAVESHARRPGLRQSGLPPERLRAQLVVNRSEASSAHPSVRADRATSIGRNIRRGHLPSSTVTKSYFV